MYNTLNKCTIHSINVQYTEPMYCTWNKCMLHKTNGSLSK